MYVSTSTGNPSPIFWSNIKCDFHRYFGPRFIYPHWEACIFKTFWSWKCVQIGEGKKKKKAKAGISSIIGAEQKQWTVFIIVYIKSGYIAFASITEAEVRGAKVSSYTGHFKFEAFAVT